MWLVLAVRLIQHMRARESNCSASVELDNGSAGGLQLAPHHQGAGCHVHEVRPASGQNCFASPAGMLAAGLRFLRGRLRRRVLL
jgi:hypothetical protein